MTLRPAVGNLRRETARYGGLLNLLAARFASQRLARHPNVSAPAGGQCHVAGIHPSRRCGGGASIGAAVLDGTLEVLGGGCACGRRRPALYGQRRGSRQQPLLCPSPDRDRRRCADFLGCHAARRRWAHDPAGAIVRAEQTVRLGRHVWIGQGVDILPGSEIGEGAMVGAVAGQRRGAAPRPGGRRTAAYPAQ
ncbi:MAG: hypothetical protein IPO15_02910 [Anaerolineae bacterium]|nr:hypothetical protein [Anaerolineae bacterium]